MFSRMAAIVLNADAVARKVLVLACSTFKLLEHFALQFNTVLHTACNVTSRHWDVELAFFRCSRIVYMLLESPR